MEEVIQTFSTPHRAYQIGRHTFVKRELAPHELMLSIYGKTILLPPDSGARLENEFYMLQHIRENTAIPVPVAIKLTKEHGALTLTTSCVDHDAVAMQNCSHKDPSVVETVEKELIAEIIPALQREKSTRMGGLNKDERLLVPPRVADPSEAPTWPRLTSEEPRFVLCHNDLSQANIFIHPTTHRIVAIVDWEYAGYYPPQFETRLWRSPSRARLVRTQAWRAPSFAKRYGGNGDVTLCASQGLNFSRPAKGHFFKVC